MIVLRFSRYVFALCATASLLAACGGPAAPQGALPIASTGRTAANATSGDLLYVTGGCGGTCVFSYPKGKLVGSLDVAGASLCSDRAGNVFIPTVGGSGTAVVYEYAHGGTMPIKTLNVPGLLAEGCAVDPKSGNLAVTYLCQNCDYGPVAIFKNARGSPKSYDVNGVFLSFCDYDGKGNLFADGTSGSTVFLFELAKKTSTLVQMSVNQQIGGAGNVQWDGKYVTIEDLAVPVIDRFQIDGSSATLAGSTALNGAGTPAAQSWIQGHTVIVPFAAQGSSPNEVGFWKYPAGGSPGKLIKKHLSSSYLAGVTVSLGTE